MTDNSDSNEKTSSRSLFAGVDGGGTKTHAVIVDESGDVLGQGTDGASNPLRVGVENAISNILGAIDNACDHARRSPADISAIQCGLAGVRRIDLRQIIKDRVSSLTRIDLVHVLTDAEIALYGTTVGDEGLVVIAGTGSVCIGQDKNGKVASAGGWGPLAGDEGGGSGIGRRALQAIAKASDGRGEHTKLSDAAVEYFRAGKLENLSVSIYAPSVDNARIAGFARKVVETAQKGDKVAIEVLREAGYELGRAALAVIKNLSIEQDEFPIGQVGGVFNAGDLITIPFMEIVRPVAPKCFFTKPKYSPAHAAALMAMKNINDWPKDLK